MLWFKTRDPGPARSRPPRRGPATPRAEVRPGPPPWDQPARLSPLTCGFILLVACGAVGTVVSVGVAVWRLIDHASDPR